MRKEGQRRTSNRIIRTEAYAETVRKLFAATVNEILALKKTLPQLDEGVMYSFDGDTVQVRDKVEQLLRRLHASATATVERGIKMEWSIANGECDELVRQCFGKKLLDSEMFRAWTSHNEQAMQAFIDRSDSGLSLSDRIWQSTRQLRDEMEMAMTVGIGEGQSAAQMSRTVRKCLNDPDLMFRRFRYKTGEEDIVDPATGEVIGTQPVYGRKWKKKVRDEKTGKVRWTDYDKDSYKTGRGVYKSSAKNAMRVARTETNMAYRNADYERWQSLDFVLGIHISLSSQHPVRDICDDVEGDYPKDFKFVGWHPQCFCYATPILVSEDEMAKVTEEFLKGNKYIPQGRQVKDTPAGFKQWVNDNSGRMRNAKSLPYWVKDNPKYVDAKKGEAINSDIIKKNVINRQQCKEIGSKAKKIFKNTIWHSSDAGLDITLTNRGVKEWLNQPHKHFAEKNEMLLNIGNVIEKAKYLGYGADKHDPMIKAHLFETKISGDKSWIIVREFPNGNTVIHSISDSDGILNLLKKTTDSV